MYSNKVISACRVVSHLRRQISLAFSVFEEALGDGVDAPMSVKRLWKVVCAAPVQGGGG
jgi:hypothetical protein